MTSSPQISPEEIEAKWLEIAPLIDRVTERIGDSRDFLVTPGSSLAGDDAASSPYQVSHVVKSSITAGVDHLHALKVLIRDAHVLHALAPFSLARGALENLSIAYWVLLPSQRNVRIEHALRWHAQNYLDGGRALVPRGHPNSDPAPKLTKLEDVAQQRDITARIRTGHSSTEAVKFSEDNAQQAGAVLFAWQLCSGYAHGRAWARLGASDRVTDTTTQPGVVALTLTANEGTVQWVALEALHLLTDVLRTYDQRANAHLESLLRD
ncbi:hypothetical protein NONI108955_34290 [Nocardia ninae]|uniref:Uncharacterized protein n=1 Tax=Nocardia ninae NBRC 108245 TaxID=1210091 RepID=A0A511MRZ4_9NOCA|nr:hypothetical protein [Nocardia ninae]GEM43350.1 hypothetical protein NN4_78690 [Nocardia ninae NBRC 108245]